MDEDLNKVVDDKADTSGQEAEDKGGEKPPEKSDLELKRENLLETGRQIEAVETGEKKEEEKEEEEILNEEDYLKKSLGEILEKYPKIKNLNPKTWDEILTRYEGGLKTLEEEGEFLADLKKLGVDSPQAREELKAKLKAKEEITPAKKPEIPKAYKETRREKLSAFLPKQVIDPETEQPRPMTEEEKNTQLSYLENWAESIVPAETVDTVDTVVREVVELKDKLFFNLFRLEPILEQFKDKILPDSAYDDLVNYSQEFSHTFIDIIKKASKEGQNPYKPLWHHYITMTKKDKIEAEQKKQWEEERAKEEKKKVDAKSETKRSSGQEAGGEKPFKDLSLEQKRANLAKRMNQLA